VIASFAGVIRVLEEELRVAAHVAEKSRLASSAYQRLLLGHPNVALTPLADVVEEDAADLAALAYARAIADEEAAALLLALGARQPIRSCACPAYTTASSCASERRPFVMTSSGRFGVYVGAGGSTVAIAADSTSLPGCGCAPSIRSLRGS
jgi:hypothetical protein